MHSVGRTAAGHPKGRSEAQEPRSGLTRRRPSDTPPALHQTDRTIREICPPVARNNPGNSRSNNLRNNKQQLQLFADRTSCHRWWPNQFRLLLASLAYTLLNAIRRCGLQGTGMARAQCATIRLKLLKIGAVIVRNTRRVRFHLSSACPQQDLFRLVAARLEPG